MKFKSKISYLGKKISILPWQMAEQLAVEVDVINVTQQQYTVHSSSSSRTSSFILFGLCGNTHIVLFCANKLPFFFSLSVPVTECANMFHLDQCLLLLGKE